MGPIRTLSDLRCSRIVPGDGRREVVRTQNSHTLDTANGGRRLPLDTVGSQSEGSFVSGDTAISRVYTSHTLNTYREARDRKAFGGIWSAIALRSATLNGQEFQSAKK
jgi:hypothetical protein